MENKIEIELKRLIIKLIKIAMKDSYQDDFADKISIHVRNLYAYKSEGQIPQASTFFDILKVDNKSDFDKQSNYFRIRYLFNALYEAMQLNLIKKMFYKEIESQIRDLFPNTKYKIRWADKLTRFMKGQTYLGDNENIRISTLDMLKFMYFLVHNRGGDISCLTFSDDPIVIYLMINVYFVYLKIKGYKKISNIEKVSMLFSIMIQHH
jgi:hypothetical protein